MQHSIEPVSETPIRSTLGRKLLGSIIRGLVGVVVFGCLYLLAAWILGMIKVNGDYQAAKTGVDIMISSNGVHIDFYLPTNTDAINWQNFAPLEAPNDYMRDARYTQIGWGDRGFFIDTPTWQDLTLGTALNAVFLPTPSVMHIYYWHQLPITGARTAKLRLSTEEYKLLVMQVKNGFARDPSHQPILIPNASYSLDDVFYQGAGSYHLFHTCNNWASNALARTGVTSPLWSPFDWAIFDHLPK